MSYHICLCFTVGIYILAIIGSTIHTGFMLRLLFCENNVVNHYFCNVFSLLELSCSSIYFNNFLALVYSSFNVLISVLTILISCIFVLYKTFHIHSTEGRSKAFSTCSSHIFPVAVFHGSATFMYLQSSSVSPMDQGAHIKTRVLYLHCAHAEPSDLHSAG